MNNYEEEHKQAESNLSLIASNLPLEGKTWLKTDLSWSESYI